MLKNIDFQNENRHWKIEFNRIRMLHLRGECGIGKSLFAKDLKAQKDHIANFSNILVINTEDAGSIYLLRPDTIH